jgi:hypothetical protein
MRLCHLFPQAILALAIAALGLGCAPGGRASVVTPNATEPRDVEQARVWADAERVWAKYAQLLQTRDCEGAAALADPSGLGPFLRIREAALGLAPSHLMRLRPQDVVHVLVLRGSVPAAQVEAMTPNDVFLTLCRAGALGAELLPTIRIAHQDSENLYRALKDKWWPAPSLVLNNHEPRVLSATAEFDGRFRMMNRLGLDWERVAQLPADELLSEAARLLGRQPNNTWWEPLHAIPTVDRNAAEKLLDPKIELEHDSTDAPTPAEKVSRLPSEEGFTEELGKGSGKTHETRLPGTLMRDVIRAQFPAFDVCYVDGLMRAPQLEGQVVVQFVIARSGRVSAAKYGTNLADEEVAECVTAQFQTLRFPEPSGGVVRVTYPLTFSPNAGPSGP